MSNLSATTLTPLALLSSAVGEIPADPSLLQKMLSVAEEAGGNGSKARYVKPPEAKDHMPAESGQAAGPAAEENLVREKPSLANSNAVNFDFFAVSDAQAPVPEQSAPLQSSSLAAIPGVPGDFFTAAPLPELLDDEAVSGEHEGARVLKTPAEEQGTKISGSAGSEALQPVCALSGENNAGSPGVIKRKRALRPASASPDTESKAAPTQTHNPRFYLNKALGFLENGVEIGGHRHSGTNVLVAALIAAWVGWMILCAGFQLLGGVSNCFSGAAGQLGSLWQPAGPTLSGVWDLDFNVGRRLIQGRMVIKQSGSNLRGYGQDAAYFEIAGQYDGKQVHFTRQAYQSIYGERRKVGSPVEFSGYVTTLGPNTMLKLRGLYLTHIKKGAFLTLRLIPVQGNWQADMVSNVVPQNVPDAASFALPSTSKAHEFQNFLLTISGGLLVGAVLIVIASIHLFGPNGMVNIWAKKGYVPSQFKSQHNKMLSEMGRALGPGGVPLGQRVEWGLTQLHKPKSLALTPQLRESNPHMLVLGAGAKGKSRLMASMVAHDIKSADRAVVVVDSDGGLIDLLVRWIASRPEAAEYVNRTILIDPVHSDMCPAYNPLEMPDDGDLQSAASSIVFGFKAIYTEPPGSQSQWNQQTANILRNAALLLMANDKTLVDLPILLSDNDFRDVLLDKVEKRKQEQVEYITLLETWGQYKRLARTDQWINWVEPILNRVSPMLSDPRIRPILTRADGELNLRDVVLNKKILLIKVPQGQLDQNANLLGSLIITGLKQAALSLTNDKVASHPCALYLDEFDNFVEKETVDAISHETKKFQIGLVSAAKTMQHLPEDFRNELIINAGTICAFALGKKDADTLGPQMFRVDGRKIKHQTLQNIFNRVNTSPQFELISDEERLNVDRIVGQEQRTYYCYRVGTVAGVFHMRAPNFDDIPDDKVDWALVDHLYGEPAGG